MLHVAERHADLLPEEATARARAIAWMLAALGAVEPPIVELATARLLEGGRPWSKERLRVVADRIREPSARLGASGWLDGGFSAGDLLMATVPEPQSGRVPGEVGAPSSNRAR